HGIKVYVIPGNHDVNNPRSFKYEVDKTISIPNITPSQFSDIYKNLGYSEALERDSNSLSYVAEPVDGLWLVALDTCRYRENKQGGEEIISGKFLQSQEKWLEEVLKKAQKAKKAVMVMEHHGLVEHWNGQAKLHPDYLVEDYKYIGKLLASYGVRLAFTGHYHAQDIAMADFNSDGVIYDIETGSLITAPCPVRYLTIAGNNMRVATDNLVSKLHPGTEYEKNAEQFVYDSVKRETINVLLKYFVPKNDAGYIADHMATAFCAHYRGDENASDRPAFDESKLNFWSRFICSHEKYIIDGLWNDLPPEDNNTVIDLGREGVKAVH
ncbi:MAG TPA: metallophosphoesterase, partial [Clostridia bacterium]